MISRKTGLSTRNASTAISASHNSMLASSRLSLEAMPENCSTLSSRDLSVTFCPVVTYTPKVSRHCLMTSGTPLVISATVGRMIFRSLADLAFLEGGISGLIDSAK
jgi:hypothetical protein